MSLFLRVFTINAAVLLVAALLLALSPASVSSPITPAEALVLVGGVAAMVAVNLVLLRRAFAPLERLTALMRTVEPLAPGRRIDHEGTLPEVATLGQAFNDMLGRLENERRDSARRALLAQESERRRLARELHDELGQSLTAMLLQLETLARVTPLELREQTERLQEAARDDVERVRALARGLRPEALEEFGLRSALVSLAVNVQERAGVRVRRILDQHLPALPEEAELVIYRVAQEGLNNIVRHADATQAELALEHNGNHLTLRVRDNGTGLNPDRARNGTGLLGMRERALLIGATVTVTPAAPRGTEVRLEVPVGRATSLE